jgi:hypothetical protein
MSDNDGYNGWKNRATWCANLWIDNDQGTQEYFASVAAEAVQQNQPDEDASNDEKDECLEVAKDQVAAAIETWVDDQIDIAMPGACMLRDLLDTDIDYREIADYMVDNAVEYMNA